MIDNQDIFRISRITNLPVTTYTPTHPNVQQLISYVQFLTQAVLAM
jgi:hypothetical protein